jgi:hypothetical protein
MRDTLYPEPFLPNIYVAEKPPNNEIIISPSLLKIFNRNEIEKLLQMVEPIQLNKEILNEIILLTEINEEEIWLVKSRHEAEVVLTLVTTAEL